MIRTACYATCAAMSLLAAQGASATVSLNARISQIVNALQNNSQFSSRNFSLSLNGPGNASGTLFIGLEGVRALNGGDVYRVNEWLGQIPASAPSNVFNGGGYTFTHSALGSFFGNQPQGGTPYTFTHEVLGAFFGNGAQPASDANEPSFVIESDSPGEQAPSGQQDSGPVIHYRLMSAPPGGFPAQIPAAVPEPASWAMMIGGFAIVGGMMRRRARLRFA